MSEKALIKFKELVDKIDTAFRIGDIEGEAVLDDYGSKLSALSNRMNEQEQNQAKKYLDQVTKEHSKFELQGILESEMDDEDEEEDVEDEMQECGGCSKCDRINISYDRRRELTKIAMELSESIDAKSVAREERAFLLTMLDNLAV